MTMNSGAPPSLSSDENASFRASFLRAHPGNMSGRPGSPSGSAFNPVDLVSDSDEESSPILTTTSRRRSTSPKVVDRMLCNYSSAVDASKANSGQERSRSADLKHQRSCTPGGLEEHNRPHPKTTSPASHKNPWEISYADIEASSSASGNAQSVLAREPKQAGTEVEDTTDFEAEINEHPHIMTRNYNDASPRLSAKPNAFSLSSPGHSIRSSSTLLQRLREQRSKSTVGSKSDLSNADPRSEPWDGTSLNYEHLGDANEPRRMKFEHLEGKLEQFHEDMMNDHGDTVRWLLHDARTTIARREPCFIDEENPFASARPVQIMGAADASDISELHSYFNKKKTGKKRVQFLTTHIKDTSPRVPKYYSYTNVRRNILTPNDPVLRHMPHLYEAETSKQNKAAHTKFAGEIDGAFIKKQRQADRAEQSAQILPYLQRWLADLDLGIGHKELIQYYLEHRDGDIPIIKLRQREALRRSFESPSDKSIVQACSEFSAIFDKVFSISLIEVIFYDEKLKDLTQISKIYKKQSSCSPKASKDVTMTGTGQDTEASSNRLDTYADLMCLICGAIQCQTHGENKSDDESDKDGGNEHAPIIMLYKDLQRKQDVRISATVPEFKLAQQQEQDTPCSTQCHLSYDYSNLEYEISPDDLAKIEGMTVTLHNKKHRSCDISFILGLPCWQVANEISQIEPRSIEIPVAVGRQKRPDWYDNKRKVLKDHWQDATKAHLHQEQNQFYPCTHDGPCIMNCPCYDSNILCEDMCGCADDCPRRWTGCSCHGSGILCMTDTCICIQLNRECGPQCVSCTAVVKIDPANKYHEELFATGCQNVVLQRGVARKVVLGESQLAGFGLYLAETVRKNHFIIEYTGEVISGSEADRRGIVYDRKFLSFLFDLNSVWVIDAARKGNLSRFINHASEEKDGLNCTAKIMFVNGEHRIKFVALRDLKVGEELLFNYGKKFAEKHGLSKKLPKAASGQRGVLTGDEDLDALDGINPKNIHTRSKGSSTRGGHSGNRGRARKTAPTRDVAELKKASVNSEKSDDTGTGQEEDDDDEEDEYMDEDDSHERRRRRKIVRPARYTR